MPLPRAVSSTLRIVEMTTSVPYSSSSSLCHLQIPNEPHRRQCGPTADRLMVLVNLLLLAAGASVMWFARATPIATAVPVLGVCLDLSAGCLIALGLLGMTATAKLTGLLYLHLLLMATMQVGSVFTVGSAFLARTDVGRVVTADSYLAAPDARDMSDRDFADLEHACDFYASTTLADAADDDTDDAAWLRCWSALGQPEEQPLLSAESEDSAYLYAVLTLSCAGVVLLFGMLTALCDLGLAATTELCMVGVEAITVVLGSCEAAFGIWVMIAAPSHNLGLFMLLLGSSNAAVGLFVAFWYTQCAHRFRRQLPIHVHRPVTTGDPADFARSRRRLRGALCVHLALLVAFGVFVLDSGTLAEVREYAYTYYCTHLPPGLLRVNADPTAVVVARVREVAADVAVASAVGVFSLCAASFTALLLGGLSFIYIPRLAVEGRDSVL